MASVLPEGNQTKKGSSKGSGFTPLEDEAIAKAWVAASEDPIVGTDQKGSDFYKSIQSIYNVKFKPVNREDRSLDSIKNRCRAIHKECMAFGGCFKRIVRSHPTGVSPTDIFNMAIAIYNGVEMGSANDDYGKYFKYLGAWKVLKQHPKFAFTDERKPPNKNVSRNGSSAASEIGSNNDGSGRNGDENGGKVSDRAAPKDNTSVYKDERPIGRKRAKLEKEKREESSKKLRLAAESVAAQKERNETLKRHYEIMLFTNAPAGCNENDAVEYFNIMRERALANIRKENNADNSNGNSPS